MDERRLLSVKEVARVLGVSQVTVRRRISTGEIPAVRLGGPGKALRVHPDELAAWIDADPDEVP